MSTTSHSGIEHFIAKTEEIEARTDAIAEANGRNGLLTMISKKSLEDGQVEVTCIAFLAGHPEQAQQAAQELGLNLQDQTSVKSPSEGQAPANLDF